MHRAAVVRWFLLLVMWTSSAALADALPPKLSLHETIEIFHARGLDFLIAEAAVQSAEGDVTAAGAIANPAVSVTYARPPQSLAFGLSDQAAISDVVFGKRHLRTDVANAALRAAKLGRADAERTLVFQVKSQFERVLLAQNALRFAVDTADANAIALEKAEKQREADKIQRPDLLRVKVAKLESDQAVDQARQNLVKARAGLAFLLGVREAVPVFDVVEPELEHYALPPSLASASHDELLAQALAARPDLKAQAAVVESSQAALALARRERVPDISLQLGYTLASPNTFSVGLAAPLPVFYQQQGEIKKAEANLRTQELQLEKLRATVVNDFESAYADFIASQALARRMEQGELLEAARQAKDDIKLLYEKGGAQLVDYLVALATYISTNLEYFDDVAGYWTAVFELEAAIGKELR